MQSIVASTPRVIGSGYADGRGVVTLRGSLPVTLTSGYHTSAVYVPSSGVGFTQPIKVSQPSLPTTRSKNQSNLFVIAVRLFVFGIVIRRTSAVISEDWQVARFTVPRLRISTSRGSLPYARQVGSVGGREFCVAGSSRSSGDDP